jgi:hypothetical protein
MKQNSKEVYETTALGYLGGRTKAIRAELRQLPHQVEEVLALLKARSEKFRQELLALKKLDTERQV